MPFNEKGEWINLNPLETYKDLVTKSREHPKSGGLLWSSDLRTRLHNEAAKYLIGLDGVSLTPQTLEEYRRRIAAELEEDCNIAEAEGFLKPKIGPDVQGFMWMHQPKGPNARASIYRHLGD